LGLRQQLIQPVALDRQLRRRFASIAFIRPDLGSQRFPYPFRSSFMAPGDGSHKLPIKSDLRHLIYKNEGDTVTIHLTERLRR
jgi:Domain of unknown function (DUF1905)